jgi:hypothetical protein
MSDEEVTVVVFGSGNSERQPFSQQRERAAQSTLYDTMTDDSHTPPNGKTSKGLLRGVNVASAKYYAAKVSLEAEDIKWFSESGLLWKAAEKDAGLRGITTKKYLEELIVNFQNFFSSGKIHDREDLIDQVDSAMKQIGSVTLVVGGKSVGKSLVMANRRNFFNSQPDGNGNGDGKLPLVLLVDGREDPGVLKDGLERAFKGLVPGKRKIINLFFTSLFRFLGEQASCVNMDDVQNILAEQHIGIHAKERKLLDLFQKLAEERNCIPCLVVDEANLFMGSDTVNENWEILVDLERRTKQKNAMAVILTSSEHVFPYKLSQANKGGLKVESVGNVVFAGEIPPKEMWDLLVTAKQDDSSKKVIGMGFNLAELCLDSYGGHVWYTSMAVEKLLNRKEDFKAEMAGPFSLYNEIEQCLKNDESKEMLKSLAKSGFCSVGDFENKQVKEISEKDIGGLVNSAGVAIGLPATVWANTRDKFGLVPTAQVLRLMIADKLANV